MLKSVSSIHFGEVRGEENILIILIGRPRRKLEDNIKMGLRDRV
jgi:hypothetical protein